MESYDTFEPASGEDLHPNMYEMDTFEEFEPAIGAPHTVKGSS